MRLDRKWACKSETGGRESAKRETRVMRGSDWRKIFRGRQIEILSSWG